MSAGTKVTVNVKDNNVEFALRKFKTQVARNGDLSRAKKRAEGYTPRGVKLREEKKQNIISSRKKNRRNYSGVIDMTLSERINNDLKEAMKSKDSFRLSVIRMVKGAMQLAKPNPREELTDDDVITVISKQIKMRNDSIKEFEAAGRSDLVEQNKKEIEILNTYMPKQLSEEELTEIIDKVFEEVKPTSQKDMGLIMKNISPLVKGKADMSLVNKLVKERLG